MVGKAWRGAWIGTTTVSKTCSLAFAFSPVALCGPLEAVGPDALHRLQIMVVTPLAKTQYFKGARQTAVKYCMLGLWYSDTLAILWQYRQVRGRS